MLHTDPTLSTAQRVDAACDHFEAEWTAGRAPKFDDYLAAAPESDREMLRSALRAVEAELKGRGAADTSVSRSSMRSTEESKPELTVQYTDSISPATNIGRFEIRGTLGAGAFGRVYRAFDPHLGREVAVKVPLESSIQSEADRARFLKEGQAAATINHPNVCQIHEVGEADGKPFIVMALVPGQSLAQTLTARKEPFPQKQSALIVRKLALALSAAHDKGIVHRDLKPANVMFDRERKDIIVMDFGLARGPRLGNARDTQSGVIMGTPAYMSPEQARGDSKLVGPAGDIYSLGVIFYELLTGTRPFSGTATEVIGKILHVEPEPPTKRRPDVDPRLEAVCLKAMAKDASNRFTTMKAFAAALDAILRNPSSAPDTETAKAEKTRREGETTATSANMAEVFAAISMERKQARAETVAAVEAVARRSHKPFIWVLLTLGSFGILFLSGFIILFHRSGNTYVQIVLEHKIDAKLLEDKTIEFFLDGKALPPADLKKPIELQEGEHTLTAMRGEAEVARYVINVRPNEAKNGLGFEIADRSKKMPPPLPVETKEVISWIPLIRSADELIEGETTSPSTAERMVRYRDGNLELRGPNASFRPKFTGKNYVLRGKILQFTGKNVMLSVRRDPGRFNGYQAFFNNPDPALDWPSYGLGKHHVGKAWQGLPGTMHRIADHFPVDFAVSAFGNKIAIYVNTEHIATHTDDDSSEGGVMVSLTENSHAVVRDFEVCVLDGTKLTPDDVFPQSIHAKRHLVLKPEYLTPERKKQNLLRNGSFEVIEPTGWKMESWRNLRESCTIIDDAGRDGSRVLKIHNPNSDDVSYKQTVQVKPISRYLFSGWIKTRNVQDRGNSRVRGAHLYVWGGHERMTPTLTNTNDWTYFAVVFRSGNRTSVDLAARLGYFAGDTAGTAWFDDLCLIELPYTDEKAVAESPPAEKADGFAPLFNGKDLTGWKAVGEPKWTWVDGRMLGSPASNGSGGLLLTDADYEDFEIKMQFRLALGAGSGLFLRTDPNVQAQGPANRGGQFEVQLIDDDQFNAQPEINKTGSIYSTFARKVVPPVKKGDWNALRVRLEKREIQVWINDVKTIDADLDDARAQFARLSGLTRKTGRIGLQQNQRADVEFKDAWIKDLTQSRTAREADRKAAEWLLSIDSEHWVTVAGQKRIIRTAADMPKEPFLLTWVHLAWNKKVTDAGLAAFRGCKDLTYLEIGDTAVTDTGLAFFKECKKLEHLNFHGARVTDAGLAHFKDCQNLKHLGLGFTGVTDAGLAYFKDCKSLTLVDLEATKVTLPAIRDFQQALPNCKIRPEWKSGVQSQDYFGSIADLKLAKPEDGQDAPSVPAPKGAVVLFDGKSLDGWVKRDGKSPAHWKLVNGAMQVSEGGDIITKDKFDGTFKLHIEFRTPYMQKASGQGRGNSGVYLQGRYEVQVLDSYGLKKVGQGDCGGIYGIAVPMVNASKAPTVWQTYDIDFTSPVFEGKKKVNPGVISVVHNGTKILDQVRITSDNTTGGAGGDPSQPGPILLQDYGNPVQFRNIWLLRR